MLLVTFVVNDDAIVLQVSKTSASLNRWYLKSSDGNKQSSDHLLV